MTRYHDNDPEAMLDIFKWSEWKARARLNASVTDPDISALRSGLVRLAQTDGPQELRRFAQNAWYIDPGVDAPRFVTAHPLPKT